MKKTNHRLLFANAQNMDFIPDESIQLVVTSPPYPMIEMWDEMFSCQNHEIKKALEGFEGNVAFELMHQDLDKVWKECHRVLQPGGFACINIGDATRTLGNRFKLYSNHFRILQYCHQIGFDTLPVILWRKQTNAPNKFMGSGMLPGAYITLEHEYILILRKGNKREFKTEPDKENRQKSAFFWEERNIWFSDLWDFKGIKQGLNGRTRKRSAAYPFELAYRLINMYSVKGDTVLDPFIGTGTTTLAAISSERNSFGIELDHHFKDEILSSIRSACEYLNPYIQERLDRHLSFVELYQAEKKDMKYHNERHGFPVMTKQEVKLELNFIKEICLEQDDLVITSYSEDKLEFHSPIPFVDHGSLNSPSELIKLTV